MKTHYLTFFILLIAWNTLHAREYPALPLHPLSTYYSYHFDGSVPRIRILADSIYYSEQNSIDYEKEGYSVYKRTSDGLTDSIYTGYGISSLFIYQYSPEGKLLLKKDGMFPLLKGTKFVYDPQGRMIADTSFYDNQKIAVTTYTYKTDTVLIDYEDFEDVGYSVKRQLSYQYTDSGYIEKTIQINRNGEVSQIDTIKNEYIFDASNQLIRGGDYQYTYLESGGYMQSYESKYYKSKKYFNDKGYATKELIETYSNIIGDWTLFEWTAEYFYNPDNPNPIIPIEVSVSQVYGVKEGVIAEVVNPAWAYIYSISGQLVKKVWIEAGKQCIPLAKGIYVVTIGKDSYKVAVR